MRLPSEKPVLTQALIASFVLIYLLVAISPQLLEFFYTQGSIEKLGITQGEWWRLITGTFLHDPSSPLHVALNSFSLFMVGMDVEAFFGRKRYAFIYLVAALGGSVASFIFMPYFTPISPTQSVLSSSVGASGAVFGVFGALTVFYALNRHVFGRFGTVNFRIIIAVLVGNLLFGILVGASSMVRVDNWGHIGGLVAGAAVGFILCPRYKLGEWRNPLVREIENTNKSPLAWVSAGIIALVVLAIFVDGLIYF